MRKTYKLALLVIFFLLLVSVGVFFSRNNFLQDGINDKTLVLSNEYLSINYVDGNLYDYDEFLSSTSIERKVSITNVSTETLIFTLSIMDIYNEGNLNIKVYDKDEKIIYDSNLKAEDTVLVDNKEIYSQETLTYKIVIKNNGNTVKFNADLLVYREYTPKIEANFKDAILSDNSISELVTNLGDLALTNEGLIASKDELGTTYYFRGSVNNNYVKINNLMFRIVRINGDGSVRLVLDGVIEGEYKFVQNLNSKDYLSNSILTKSSLYSILDEWYNDNLVNYDSYIKNSNFCYDTNYYLESEGENYTNSYNRIYEINMPALECTDGIDTAKVGLLSIDEVIYAGASKNDVNEQYYLYNENINSGWWTISTSKVITKNNVVNNFIINSDSSINYLGKLTSSYAVRPVVSITENARVSGNGTFDEPYEILS